jgi:hypothetical protein
LTEGKDDVTNICLMTDSVFVVANTFGICMDILLYDKSTIITGQICIINLYINKKVLSDFQGHIKAENRFWLI